MERLDISVDVKMGQHKAKLMATIGEGATSISAPASTSEPASASTMSPWPKVTRLIGVSYKFIQCMV